MAQYKGEKLKFAGVEGRDVYNITAPFNVDGAVYIAGRLEPSEDILVSETVFFIERNGTWYPAENLPVFTLEDPCIARINGELIFGGVRVFISDKKNLKQFNDFVAHYNGFYISWCTVFYRGSGLHDLKEFTRGPYGMKDIRLAELHDGSVGVFTRPQGGIGGKGKIGFLRLDSLSDLNPDTLSRAPLIHDHFGDEMWGGVNDVHVLDDGTIGVIGHVAHFGKRRAKHYMAMSFIFDPKTRNASTMNIIARRSNFPPGLAKKQTLKDIVFPGGLVRYNGIATLYVGLSDAEVGKIDIPDPFIKRSLNID